MIFRFDAGLWSYLPLVIKIVQVKHFLFG